MLINIFLIQHLKVSLFIFSEGIHKFHAGLLCQPLEHVSYYYALYRSQDMRNILIMHKIIHI